MKTFRADWVLPVVGEAIRDGCVAIEEGRVLWLGRARDCEAGVGPRVDLGPGVLLPGLVNAHCHLELSSLRGRVDRSGGFVPWVRDLVSKREAANEGDTRLGAAQAIRELATTGTAAVGDVSNTLAHLDLLEESGLAATVFYELIGWDPEAAGALLASAEERLATLASRAQLTVRLAAHAPHSVSARLLRGLVDRDGPAAMHVAEAASEVRFLSTGNGDWADFLEERGLGRVPFAPPGVSPVRYLDSLGALRPGLVAAHCIHVDESDRTILARHGVHVAVCPRSNRNLGVGIPPVPALLSTGVPVCLGTDSLASVDTLDLLDDMVALYREFPELPPRVVVEMATVAGARALGLADHGTIAPGQRARLAFASADRTPTDPYAFLVSGDARLRSVV